MPKVSVIIPIYKVEKTLNRCVDSLINQTLRDIEIILVDDGSPDQCPVICDRYAESDPRVKVIHKENAGLGYARNSGLEVAEGEYVGFVDSDDYVSTNMYEDLYLAAKKYNADTVSGGIKYVDNEKVTLSQFEKDIKVYSGKDEIKTFLFHHLAAMPYDEYDSKYGAYVTNAIFSMRIIKDYSINFFSERDYISEDSIFDVDYISKISTAVMLPKHYYVYDFNSESLTSSYRPDRFEKNKELYQLISKKIMQIYGDQKFVFLYGRYFLAAARVCAMQEALNGNGISGIRKISSDPLLRSILKEYPWMKLPFKKKIFTICVYMHWNFAQFLLIYLMQRGK